MIFQTSSFFRRKKQMMTKFRKQKCFSIEIRKVAPMDFSACLAIPDPLTRNTLSVFDKNAMCLTFPSNIATWCSHNNKKIYFQVIHEFFFSFLFYFLQIFIGVTISELLYMFASSKWSPDYTLNKYCILLWKIADGHSQRHGQRHGCK